MIHSTYRVGPVVLTCKHHHKGNNKMMIHTPRLPGHILPSKYSDQLAHAVIHCRTVRPMRKTKYSTQFELFEQKGTFNGVDTFGLTDFKNMEISSDLLAHYESLSIFHRRDTNALLNTLSEEGKIGKCVVNDRRDEARYRVGKLNMDVDDLVSGATYVPIKATMKLVKAEASPDSRFRTYSNPDSSYPNNKFCPIWPLSLFPCQKMDRYGARFPNITTLYATQKSNYDAMDNYTSISLWTTLALLTRIEVIWEAVSEVDLCTTQWEGWILNHLSKCYFPTQSSGRWSKSDPFKLHECNSNPKLYKKFDQSNSFMADPNVVFEKAKDRIFIIDCEIGDDNEDHLNTIDSHDVLLYHGYYMDGTALEEIKIINNIEFELRFVSAAYEKDEILEGTSKIFFIKTMVHVI